MSRESNPGTAGLEFTPALAMLITLVVVLVELVLSQLLFSAVGTSAPASFGIALVLGFGAGLAMAAPFIPDPPARSIGVCAAPTLAWLAVPLLVPSLLLASELDNLLKLVARAPELPAPAGGSAPRLGELMLVELLVLPVVLEVFFRGAIQPRLVRIWGVLRGVIGAAAIAGAATSFLFVNPWAVALTTAQALVLGILRQCAGSILPGLLLASIYGAGSLLAEQHVFGIPGFDDTAAAHTPLSWLLGAALLTGAGLLLCRLAATKHDGPPSRDGGPSSFRP